MIFFDSYAILEFIRGNPSYKKYGEYSLVLNTLNLAEVLYSLFKLEGIKKSKEILNTLNFEFVEISEEIAIEATEYRFKNRRKKLSYADCIGYITAKKLGFKFLTGDKGFKGMKNVEFVK